MSELTLWNKMGTVQEDPLTNRILETVLQLSANVQRCARSGQATGSAVIPCALLAAALFHS